MLQKIYRQTNLIIIVLIAIIIASCNENKNSNNNGNISINQEQTKKKDKVQNVEVKGVIESRDTTDFEKVLIKAGLVDVQSLDPEIHVDLKYSTVDNFLGMDLYGDFDRAYLQKEAADKIIKAQKILTDSFPGYHLVIYDATRPRSIQQIMWDNFDKPPAVKRKYLADPKYASMHSYGIAVDISILDENDKPLDMATGFDCFDELAYPIFEDKYLKQGKLTREQYNNRRLLRSIMESCGFKGITTEWWHFSLYGKIAASKKYDIIESHELPKDTHFDREALVSHKQLSENDIHITFKVQIKTSIKAIQNRDVYFHGLKVWEYYHEGMYKYTVGEFTDLASAYEMRDKIKELGYSDCFVAGFNNNKRIGIRDAINLIQ